MRVVTSLLFALAAGCATYTAGAIVWSIIDPQHAGLELLFTIPIAFAGTALPALLGVFAMLFVGAGPDPKPRVIARRQPHRTRAHSNAQLDDDFELSLA